MKKSFLRRQDKSEFPAEGLESDLSDLVEFVRAAGVEPALDNFMRQV